MRLNGSVRIVALLNVWLNAGFGEDVGLKALVFAILGIASILAGCATNSSEQELRCSRAVADPDCPAGTPARTESEYSKDVGSIDDARCRAMAGNSIDKYRKCLADYQKDRHGNR